MTSKTQNGNGANAMCFTLNNWTEEEFKSIGKWKGVKYLVVGKEVGENGTPHLQGYVEWKSTKLWTTVHNKLPRAHWEGKSNLSTPKQAAEYCKKDGKFFEYGELSNQGERSDLNKIRDLIREGVIMEEIATENFSDFCRYHKAWEKYQNLLQKPRTQGSKIFWSFGESGTGKTQFAVSNNSENSMFIKDGTMWWDGYTQQDKIIIDDFDGKWPYRDFLRLLDPRGLAYQGQVKGSFVNINSKEIYITCEHPPSHFWWGNELKQVTRRIYGSGGKILRHFINERGEMDFTEITAEDQGNTKPDLLQLESGF